MIEYKKSQIISLLKETIKDIDEMAIGRRLRSAKGRKWSETIYDEKGNKVKNKFTGKPRIRKFRVPGQENKMEIEYDASHLRPYEYRVIIDPVTKEKKRVKKDKFIKSVGYYKRTNLGDIPDYWVLNPTESPDGEFIAVPIDCDDLQEFMEREKDYLELIYRYHRKIPLNIIACKGNVKPLHAPQGKKLNVLYTTNPEFMDKYTTAHISTGKKEDINKTLKTLFNKIFKDYFGEFDERGNVRIDNANAKRTREIFNQRNIPLITLTDKFLNKHDYVWNNDRINYEGISYLVFKNEKEYYNSIMNGANDATNQFSQRYKWNQIKKNWEDTRPTERYYLGKTTYYNLDRLDYKEGNYNILIKNKWKISGSHEGNKFRWFMNMMVDFGDKRPRQYKVREMIPVEFKPNVYNITVEKIVDLDPQKQMQSENYVVMRDIDVVMGLRELLYDFIEKVKEVKPENALQYIDTSKLNIRENYLVNKVLSEIKSRF